MGARVLLRILSLLLPVVLVAAPGGVLAQAPASGEALLRPEELDQLLAPIALYPDALLAQVLMAATYPLEVVEAARWAKDSANVKGDAVAAALRDRPWDPSVKSLAEFPDVLGMLSERLDWTQKLGDAFLAQQRDVVTAVQRLRRRAQDAGTLKSGQQQVVTAHKDAIVIQPATPQAVYVPSYDPASAYGAWPYPAYPPPPPPPSYAATGAALGFTAAVVTGAALFGSMDWNHGEVTINNNVTRYGNVSTARVDGAKVQAGQTNRWTHDPAHRKAAPYRSAATAQRYGQARPGAAQFSGDARGYGSGQGPPAADGGAFGGVGAGNLESMASQRGSSSRSGSLDGGQRPSGAASGARAGGGGGRRR